MPALTQLPEVELDLPGNIGDVAQNERPLARVAMIIRALLELLQWGCFCVGGGYLVWNRRLQQEELLGGHESAVPFHVARLDLEEPVAGCRAQITLGENLFVTAVHEDDLVVLGGGAASRLATPRRHTASR